jgi:DNA-nicking Smr family endonuclease
MMMNDVKNTIYTEMSEKDQKQFRKWLRGVLKMHETTIIFTKKDGSERKMRCTLNENAIPSEKSPKKAGKAQSEEAIAVFDVEKSDWRSFRFDSVKKIEFSIGD